MFDTKFLVFPFFLGSLVTIPACTSLTNLITGANSTVYDSVSLWENRQQAEKESCGDTIRAVTGWQGEYPGSVVQVAAPATLEARVAPCSSSTISCTLQPGLYHPWTTDESINKATYITVSMKKSYKLDQALKIVEYEKPDKTYPAGTVFDLIFYYGENNCQYEVNGVSVEHTCPGEYGEPALKEVPSKKNDPLGGEDWEMLVVECSEGPLGWLRVNQSLFSKNENILLGQITGWQEIGPYGSQGI